MNSAGFCVAIMRKHRSLETVPHDYSPLVKVWGEDPIFQEPGQKRSFYTKVFICRASSVVAAQLSSKSSEVPEAVLAGTGEE